MRPNWFLWHLAHLVLLSFCVAMLKLRYDVRSRELEGPVVWVAKHCAWWETPLVGHLSWRLVRERPSFEMSSFHGYAFLGRVRGLLRALGGFEVMRPKDLLRLKHAGAGKREELGALMEKVNAEAGERRRGILRAGGAYAFYPEGTRDAAVLRPFKSEHEIREAIALATEEGIPVSVVPVAPCYGARPRPWIPFLRRRPVTLVVLEPVPLVGRGAEEVLADIRRALEAVWVPEPR
ncbi:MAG: hypothetical protein R3F20_14340 [Planctomycetota bacterium]